MYPLNLTAPFWQRPPLQCIICALLLLFSLNAKGQQKKADAIISEIITAKPLTYQELDGAFRSFRRDSIILKQLISRAKTINYLEGQSYAYNQLGTVYRNLSEFKNSIALHNKALQLADAAKNIELKVLSLNMLGVVYRRKDAIKTALDYSQQALELAEAVENPSHHILRHINISLNGIGNLYLTLGQYDLAITQFKRALELETQLNNKLGLAINNQNIGECYEKKGELEKALEFYRTSLALNEDIDNDYGRIICKNSIAQVYLKKQMPTAALQLLDQLLEPARNLGDQAILSSILINSGWANMELKKYGIARNLMIEGKKAAEDRNIPSLVMYANQRLSELEDKRGNHKVALAYFKEANAFEKNIQNERNLQYINDLILRYESEKKNNQISDLAQENELVKLRLRKNQTTILVIGLVVGLFATIMFIMYRQYQSNNEKRLLGLEQHMLRSQMNPHFLFNSLNSIKLYIINNDQKNAVHYLNKFSKLVRRILEGSSLKETALSEELETVELYLNIENIRFSNEINYTIQVEDNVETERIKIPSLVLQPFLENAIWHGLSAKEGEKHLKVHVSKKDDSHLQISIVDNGVGRKVSEQLKENRVLKRKSVGIDITKERLANFAKDYQYDFNVEIIDLFQNNSEAKGTKILLEIPMV
ncbi:Putative signal transduction histidine kinase [Croceitalea dokdonensis DOKDO 023]|uniref:Putative signal transduction histidine kinase n=1 Tax=Croceitalea dokdonensis DOKDO 023 TaxID=1300341 RepID=A0A0P7AVL6_9FLAO|nr:Putative signal transduction histidine kinase [Croceitalea dokdonensis DOKDO 023]